MNQVTQLETHENGEQFLVPNKIIKSHEDVLAFHKEAQCQLFRQDPKVISQQHSCKHKKARQRLETSFFSCETCQRYVTCSFSQDCNCFFESTALPMALVEDVVDTRRQLVASCDDDDDET